MSDCDFESARNHYRPDVIKVLFIGESRPKSGKFFYQADTKHKESSLYIETEKAFNGYFAQNIFTLDNFKRWGCWLYDICDEPVNGLPKGERRDHIYKSIPRLIELVQHENPKFIIVCKKGLVEQVIKNALDMSSYPIDKNIFFLPFPGFGNQKKYREGLNKALKIIKLLESGEV